MVKQLLSKDFENEIENSKGITVVDFYATWCGPCKMLSPIMEEISEEGVNVFKVDVDQEVSLASRFNVNSIPTVLVFKDGTLIKTSLGYKPKNAILELLK